MNWSRTHACWSEIRLRTRHASRCLACHLAEYCARYRQVQAGQAAGRIQHPGTNFISSDQHLPASVSQHLALSCFLLFFSLRVFLSLLLSRSCFFFLSLSLSGWLAVSFLLVLVSSVCVSHLFLLFLSQRLLLFCLSRFLCLPRSPSSLSFSPSVLLYHLWFLSSTLFLSLSVFSLSLLSLARSFGLHLFFLTLFLSGEWFC